MLLRERFLIRATIALAAPSQIRAVESSAQVTCAARPRLEGVLAMSSVYVSVVLELEMRFAQAHFTSSR